ncbi:arylamine N-acetyltransferase [Bacillus mesophilum]|uniref:Arylamine N-acetyltransferase n=1 Tax=Bacillus mesophilum TaxID=1071718 RepID=A0A7V7RKE9_9BACI|nr:arylamine N-acetyltransferase [Bacillus mesophilum]KAB2331718.1 arylamine N-acetyltransferase [Bacillus mesophilum]
MGNITDTVNKYLDCLNLILEKPSYKYLEKICYAHLNTFPFENISKLLYFKNHHYSNFNLPTFELFIKNFKEYNYGGTCYTLNSNLMFLLTKIGFDCYHVMLGEEHMAIIVKIDNERFYIDCGAAAPFFKPVRFEGNFENISSFGKDEVNILPEEPHRNRYKYVRYINGKQSGKAWHFNSRKEVKVSDFNDVIEKSNKPNSTFMTILRCQLYQTSKQRSISLVNNKLSIRYSNGKTNVFTLSSPGDIREVLTEEFMLPNLPVIEAIEVLKTLKINIFEQST